MFSYNKTICLVIVVNDLYVKKKKQIKKLFGVDSAYPFCDINRGRLCLDAQSKHTCKVHLSPGREFVRFENKQFSCIFPAMPTKCIAAGCSKTTKDWVSLHGWSDSQEQQCLVVRYDVFFSAVQHFLFKYRASIDVTNSALSGRGLLLNL